MKNLQPSPSAEGEKFLCRVRTESFPISCELPFPALRLCRPSMRNTFRILLSLLVADVSRGDVRLSLSSIEGFLECSPLKVTLPQVTSTALSRLEDFNEVRLGKRFLHLVGHSQPGGRPADAHWMAQA